MNLQFLEHYLECLYYPMQTSIEYPPDIMLSFLQPI